jgi:osmotically-inducible protein OsmY
MRVLAVVLLLTLVATGPVAAASGQPASSKPIAQTGAYLHDDLTGLLQLADYSRSDRRAEEERKLYNRVDKALRSARGFDESNINVRVDGRNIYLSGVVGSDRQKARAFDVAQSVRGVERVYTDDLRVASSSPWGRSYGYYSEDDRGPRSFDRRLHDRAHSALERQLGADASRIDVDVRDRVVYVSGLVDSPEERRQALDAIRSIEGVREVHAADLRVDAYSREGDGGYRQLLPNLPFYYQTR